VPIPPISLQDFTDALQPHLDELPEAVDRAEVTRTLKGLYAAHLATAPPLGPAVFLGITAYLAHGLALLDPSEFGDSKPTPEAGLGLAVSELIAEGYLLGAGTWLAQLEPDELASFRHRVVEETLLSDAQWTVIQELLPSLA